MNSEMSTNRLVWVDALRVFACFGVIALHVWAPLVGMFARLPRSLWWEANVVLACIAWCVPVFVLISGALQLEVPHHAEAGPYLAKRSRLFLQIAGWTVLFLLFRIHVEHDLIWRQALAALWQGTPYYHLWFLYMIAGLYVCTPFFCRYVRAVPSGIRLLVAVAAVLSACVWNFLKLAHAGWPQEMCLTLFIPFTGYYLLGYELRHCRPGPGRAGMLLACFMGVLVGLVVLSRAWAGGALPGVPAGWLFGSFSPVVAVMSVCLFQCFHAVDQEPEGAKLNTYQRRAVAEAGRPPVRTALFPLLAGVGRLSPLTLGIYVVHPLFIRFLQHMGFPGEGVDPHVGVVLNMGVVFAWSAVTVWALSRIPYISGLVKGGG